MSTMTPEEMEGRLNAHRELMIDWLAALMSGETATKELLRRLGDDATFKDNEEDPGVVPGAGYAIENAAARETRSILEAARARMKAQTKLDEAH